MVPTSFTASTKLQFALDGYAALTGFNPATTQQLFAVADNWTFGVGINQINEVYLGLRPLVASGNETLDLTGSLIGPLGETITFARIKYWMMFLVDGGASSITVGGATKPFLGPLSAGNVTILGSDNFEFTRSDATGWAVTGGTNDEIKVLNNDVVNAASYVLFLMGCTI